MERIQQTTLPIGGLATGAGTATFAKLSELATVAEQVGMIAGCILTLCLLADFAWKKIKALRKK